MTVKGELKAPLATTTSVEGATHPRGELRDRKPERETARVGAGVTTTEDGGGRRIGEDPPLAPKSRSERPDQSPFGSIPSS